jgi:hypothetical protein
MASCTLCFMLALAVSPALVGINNLGLGRLWVFKHHHCYYVQNMIPCGANSCRRLHYAPLHFSCERSAREGLLGL